MRVLKTSILFVGVVLLCSYFPADDFRQNTGYKPILMERAELENSIKFSSPQDLKNPGKIYLKDQYLFIVEKYKGIHIIDNTNRSTPVNKAFIQIFGCIDLAIKGEYLYADNAVDLVTVKIKDVNSMAVTGRVKEAFPELTPPDIDFIPYEYTKDNRPEGTVIVAWEKE